MTTDREKVLAAARGWLGIREGTQEHRQIIDLYNAHRPAGSYKMTYGDAWCAAFVSAVGMAAGVAAILPGVNCDNMIADYRQRGQWVEDDSFTPTPGDLIFYDWQDDGRNDNRGGSDHVGIVVDVDGKLITVIEGNLSDRVGQRYIYEDGKFIRGFAVPGYGEDTNVPAMPGQAVILDKPEGAVAADGGETAAPVSKSDTTRVCTVQLPVLRMGDGIEDPSDTVRAAQLLLIGRGFRCGSSGADGEFGPATYGSVCAFQSGYDLAPGGVIGEKTWTRLIKG